MSNSLTIATANTQESLMFENPKGLLPFTEKGVEVLMMQEVLGITEESLNERLEMDNYNLGHFDPDSGLAIAVSTSSTFQPKYGTERTEIIQHAEKIGKFIRNRVLNIGQRFRPRALVSIELSNGADDIIVASTHPIIFIRAMSRAKQINEIGKVLQLPYYQKEHLIIGGDMNHYPSLRSVDVKMRENAQLETVEIAEPTWRIRGSRHEWVAKIGSRILRRSIDSFDGELDAILFRGLLQNSAEVCKIDSDHDAIIASLSFK